MSKLNLSKSNYCALWQCPKMAWLNKYKPEEKTEDADLIARFSTGNEVGDLARRLFGGYVDVTCYEEDRLNLQKMIKNTKTEIEKGTAVICEAAFSYKGLYCAVDLLKKEPEGWTIYEVKSSSNDPNSPKANPIYIADISFQKYVLEHCGISVVGTYLITINSQYVRGKNLDIHQLFHIMNVEELVLKEIGNVEANIQLAERILLCEKEPDSDLDKRCKNPYACRFWEYCTRNLPKPNVFDLYKLDLSKKLEHYRKGEISFKDLEACGGDFTWMQKRQIEYELHNPGPYWDDERLDTFLECLSFPIYFLDFETMMFAIPLYEGTKPYQQIPFQYSLHYMEEYGGELKHKEFLGISGQDPRRDIAEALCRDIPTNACVTAYNKAFECSRLEELANVFPDLADHLRMIKHNIVDLLVPFSNGFYYNRAMGGSFSIKSVLPALYPDNPELDYHNLEDVHNGSEAMTIFPMIQYMEPDEQEKIRRNLLKYCELDTYAMVMVWEKLRRL